MSALKVIPSLIGSLCFCWASQSLAGQNSSAQIALSEAVVAGDTLSYCVTVSSAVKTTGVLVKFEYSTSCLSFDSWEGGDFIDNAWTWGPFLNQEKETVMIAVATTNKFPTTDASGEVGTARFVRVGPGDTQVSLIEADLSDEDFREDHIIDSENQIQRARPVEADLPVRFALQSIWPNPMTRSTEIHFDIPRPGADVRIKIYDVTGREVRTLVDERRPAGYHLEAWDLRNNGKEQVAPGMYFCRMEAGDFAETKKLILLR